MKFIIRYNTGYGDNVEIVDAENIEEANRIAADAWYEDMQSQADYGALDFTYENCEEYGLEEEHPDYVESDDE